MNLQELIKQDIQNREMNVLQYADLMDKNPRQIYRILAGTVKPSIHLQMLTLLTNSDIIDLKNKLAEELKKKFERTFIKPYNQRIKDADKIQLKGLKNLKIDRQTVTKRIKDKGTTMAEWSRINGFSKNSVITVICESRMNGETGDKIREALIKDEFLFESDFIE